MQNQKYIEVPGNKVHELPPLLIHTAECGMAAGFPDLSAVMPEAADMLPDVDADEKLVERRKFELALQLAEQYKGMMAHWLWGDSILEWIRQCEITFGSEGLLRSLLRPDVWPHASQVGFVELLIEKAIPTPGVAIEKAMGTRLAFRHLPPIECCSNHLLLYLFPKVADEAFRDWSNLAPPPSLLFPPDRFHFDVISIGN